MKQAAVAATTALALLLSLNGVTTASAAVAKPSGVSATATAITFDSDLRTKIEAARVNLLLGGKAEVGIVNGIQLSAVRDADGFHLAANSPNAQDAHLLSWCAAAIAGAILTLGAALLGLAAAMGGLTIGGYFLAPALLTRLAMVAGTFAAIYDLVSQFVC